MDEKVCSEPLGKQAKATLSTKVEASKENGAVLFEEPDYFIAIESHRVSIATIYHNAGTLDTTRSIEMLKIKFLIHNEVHQVDQPS